ncbi:hypothetical protein Aperf_G00000028116 [Anoplocephala perfoliata]
MTKSNGGYGLDSQALYEPEQEHSFITRTSQNQMKPEFLCENSHKTMYPSVLLSRMMALQARYLSISDHNDKLESASAEMLKKFQSRIEKDFMMAECCLQAMDALSKEKNRNHSENGFDLPGSGNSFNDTGLMTNHLTEKNASESSEDFSSHKENEMKSLAENEKMNVDQPLEPVLIAKGKYLLYQLLPKLSKVRLPPFEAVEEYFLKMDGVEKVCCPASNNAGYIVFKSKAHAQNVLSVENHAVNGCKIRLFPCKRLPKSMRETESQVSDISNPGTNNISLTSVQPSMSATTSVLNSGSFLPQNAAPLTSK